MLLGHGAQCVLPREAAIVCCKRLHSFTVFVKYYKTKGIKTKVGYTGGKAQSPSYSSVCSGRTGHAESVRIEFDPSQVAYAELVEFFYRTHDPTTLNSQGADRGTRTYTSL